MPTTNATVLHTHGSVSVFIGLREAGVYTGQPKMLDAKRGSEQRLGYKGGFLYRFYRLGS